jgi:competence/damage-inducible protein CinA-like protein
MKPLLEIFSQGEELVTGQIVDTNAAWLSQQAVDCGFTVTRHTAVGDNLSELVALLLDIAQRADCCICTGGLGPTSDDLTALAVAQAFDLPLIFDVQAYEQIARFFANRHRDMPESNRKQAMFPQGAERIDNHWGTAPGFSLRYQRCWFVFLPGVPMEMKHLFQEQVLPSFSQRFSLQPGLLITFKTFGIGESACQELINAIEIPTSVQLGFRAGTDDVHIKLLFPIDYPTQNSMALIADFSEQLGDFVFAIDGLGDTTGDLVFEINKQMVAKNRSLAVIETISHGLLAAKCITCDWLLSANYQQSSINSDAQVDVMAVAEAMAYELIKNSGTDYVLVQLYAGDKDCLHDKEKSIAIDIVLLTDTGLHKINHSIAGSIQRKQNQAALLSLDLLRRYLSAKL